MMYEIDDNTKFVKKISELVSIESNMNSITKDLLNVKREKQLDKIKNRFETEEKNFESIKTKLQLYNDGIIDSIFHKIFNYNTLSSNLSQVYKNENSIEPLFYVLYKTREEKLRKSEKLLSILGKERILRDNLETIVVSHNNMQIMRIFAKLEYYSKEAIYQYKDIKHFDLLSSKIKQLRNSINSNIWDKYQNQINSIKTLIFDIAKESANESKIAKKLFSFVKKNNQLNEEIKQKLEILSSGFLINLYKIFIILSVIIVIVLLLLRYKIYYNVGLSVDEISNRVENGLKTIKVLNKEIQDTQKEVIFTMGAIGETRSKETGNHVKRVAEYSMLLAKYYGLDEETVQMIKQASPMHDIGKVGIPDSVLNKPGRFDEKEREIMNTHAKLGYDMLKHSNRPLLKMAATIAYTHHEKYDGAGYPQGLKGEQIDIAGRITALADVFDALGSHRVYKKAWKDEDIFNLIKSERGKHFDPKLVDIFFEHLDKFLKIRDNFKDTLND